VARGVSTAQIEQTLVDEYGQNILLEPPDSGGFAVIWIVPIVSAAGALVVVGALFWRRSRLFAATSAAQAKVDTDPDTDTDTDPDTLTGTSTGTHADTTP
jgi:cytochrome c-type biogenesis protein CcmH/NrfF